MKKMRLPVPILSLLFLSLLVRVIYNNTVARAYYPTHDSLAYQTIGFNIIREHCFCWQPYMPTVYRAPLWPAIIAAITLILGPGDYYARLFLCCIGSGTCILVYLLAKELFCFRIGIVTGAVAAIYPNLYIYDGWLYTESLYTFLLLAFCYGIYQLQRSQKRNRWWLWCGVSLGLLALTRPNGLFMLGVFIFWALVMGWEKILSWRVVTKSVLFISLISLAIIAPWTVRNYFVSHAFIPVATGDGTVLLGAYNNEILSSSQYLGLWVRPLEADPAVAKPYPENSCAAPCEVKRESVYRDAAEQWIRSHISLMPYLLQLHMLNMWQVDVHEADLPTQRFPDLRSTKVVLSMMKLLSVPIFLLAASGFAVTRRRWREFLFIYLILLMTVVQCLVFYGSPRFRAPIEPMLLLLAAGAVWWLSQKDIGKLRRLVIRPTP
jgi:4-amino-4-deoxy-L-arabinose transferase-like glycosyltransferase